MGELEILYQAAASPCGVVVLTDNVQLALQRFYKARKAANDETLSCLQLRRNPQKPEEEIWIINQGKRTDGASTKSTDEQPMQSDKPIHLGASDT